MNEVVAVDMSLGSLAVLISGLYTYATGVSVDAIPSSLYIEIAENISIYQPFNVDEFVAGLMIAPIELFSESELLDYRENNALYIERRLGNATLVATAKDIS